MTSWNGILQSLKETRIWNEKKKMSEASSVHWGKGISTSLRPFFLLLPFPDLSSQGLEFSPFLFF